MRPYTQWFLGPLVVLVTVGLGFAVGAWFFSPVVPDQLRAQDGAAVSPVTSQRIDDARVVDVSLELEELPPLLSSSSGIVTAFDCQPDDSLTSGTTSMSVNGERVVSLATTVPLWRDLVEGDEGDDVLALQEELARLGYPVTPEGEVGPVTLASAADLLGLTGQDASDYAAVRAGSFLWLPGSEARVETCLVGVNSRIDAGSELLSLAATLTGASVSVPENLVSGERTLEIEGHVLPVGPDGEVTGPESLSLLQWTSAFTAWHDAADRSQTIRGRLVLAEPVEVYALAPASVYALAGALGCVRTESAAYPVAVISSQLGQTLVTFESDGAVPSTVLMSPAEEPACRSN